MVRNVSGLNNIIFRSNKAAPQVSAGNIQTDNNEIQKLNYTTTPDFQVKTPVTYKLIGKDELPNGLTVHSYKLSNGYKVSVIPMENSPAVVKTYVNVGSMNETPDIKGISHFLEHMAFNGTNGADGHMKLETGDSFKKIDKLGGWTNASTNYAITDYVNSAPLLDKNDLETQIKVLAAMTEDLKLSDEMIKKEKGPVSSEINMILDNPQTVVMDQTLRTLFNIKNPADELVGGSVKHIQNLTRKDVTDYYNKYYTPDNINIVVSGDINPEETIELISKNFTSDKMAQGKRFDEKLSPINHTVRKDFVTDKAKSAEIMLGFAGPNNNNIKDRILYQIATLYLYSESSGLNKNLREFNTSLSIGTEKISTNPNAPRLIYAGATVSDENCEKVLNTVFNTISNIKPITNEELERIKDDIKTEREHSFEYSETVNNMVGNSVLDGGLDYVKEYDNILENITPEEVDTAIKKYFDLNKAAITVIHPKKADNTPSFKGNNNRLPIKEENVSVQTLDNNFDVGFYKTKTNNKTCDIKLITDTPYNKKAGVRDILNEIYTMGSLKHGEDEFNKLKEDLNLNIVVNSGANGLSLSIEGNDKNYIKGLGLAKELIYNPNINENTLKIAKERIRENLENAEVFAGSLYYNKFYSKYDEYAFSDDEILRALDSITVDDIKDFHQYILNNSRGIITSNINDKTEQNDKENIVNFANSLNGVKPNTQEEKPFYKPVSKTEVLISAENNSQADIKMVYNFKFDDTIKNNIASQLTNSILTNSSIGLFNTLREKEHLAYSVYSDINTENDWGEISLNILTTTDNKEIGEQSYDNLQKSINGFKHQINELLEGKFTDEDMENAKRSLKAKLLQNEGSASKVNSLYKGLNSKYGANYYNQIYKEIDNLTKEDIIEFAQNAFSGNPVYAITATKDTLDANKDFLTSLES